MSRTGRSSIEEWARVYRELESQGAVDSEGSNEWRRRLAFDIVEHVRDDPEGAQEWVMGALWYAQTGCRLR
jgi:hypothetical protein